MPENKPRNASDSSDLGPQIEVIKSWNVARSRLICLTNVYRDKDCFSNLLCIDWNLLRPHNLPLLI